MDLPPKLHSKMKLVVDFNPRLPLVLSFFLPRYCSHSPLYTFLILVFKEHLSLTYILSHEKYSPHLPPKKIQGDFQNDLKGNTIELNEVDKRKK